MDFQTVNIGVFTFNPVVVNLVTTKKKDPGNKPRHKRSQEEQQGWSRKQALAKKQKDAEMTASIQRQWRILHGLPVEELSKIVPKIVDTNDLGLQLERLALITRGQQMALQQKFDDYKAAIEQYNEQMIQHLLSNIL